MQKNEMVSPVSEEYHVSTTASDSGAVSITHARVASPIQSSARDVRGAVYAHIKALRALGRTSVNSVEIADALGLPLSTIEQAIQDLEAQGVKVIR